MIAQSHFVHRLFETQAAEKPDHAAVTYSSQEVSYRELNERANRLAHVLRGHGVGKSEPVAILLERSVEMVVSLLGVLKAGAAFVPLDPNYPPDRLAMILDEVAPRFAITSAALQESIEFPESARVLPVSDWDDRRDVSVENPELIQEPEDLNYMYYTSGSTGRPKGVMGCHKSLAHFIRWEIEEFGITANDRVSQFAALSFDASLRDLFVPLCSGGTVCLPERETVQDREKLVNWIEAERLTVVHCVPSVFRQLLAELEKTEPSARAAKFPHLRCILMAGEVLDVKHVRQWMEIFGTRIQLVNLYGSTETTMIKLFHRIEKLPPEGKPIPVGKAMRGAAALILNEMQKLCGIGQVGEIYIRSPYLSLGYYQRPDLNDGVFLQNPLNPNPEQPDRVYRTGDLGRYLSDGSVEYIGRCDNQVKVRGIRVELGEIEAALHGVDGIREAVVVTRTEAEGDNTLIAYFTGVESASAQTVESLRAALRRKLPDAMIPSQFHELAEMPLLPNGKIDRKSLEALALDAKPELGREYAEPETETEKLLAAIWSNVLGVEKVGARDSFFALGGHSILAMQVLARVKETTRAPLKLGDLFDHLTIRDLAAYLDEITRAGRLETTTSIPQSPKRDSYPLSHTQSRIWFQQQLDLQNSSYNMPYSVTLRGEWNHEAFEGALNALIARQAVLRTRFLEQDGVPCQIVLDDVRVTIPVEDLTGQDRDLQEAFMNKWMDDDARTAFDLGEAPLLRTRLFRLRENEHKFYINFHHIIADGASMSLLIQSLANDYHALLHGQAVNGQAPEISFVDYAVWQQSRLEAGVYQEEEAYWTERLAKPLPVLNLPLDFDRPAVMQDEGAILEWQLDPELARLAQEVAQREGTSLFVLLFAVYHLLLHRLSGDDDIIVGTPVATRTEREVENLLGVFINTLAIRVKFGEHETFRSLLEQVKARCLEAFDRQSYPFDLLVENVQPERDLSRPALFSVQFVFPNAPTGLHLPGLQMSEPTVHRQSSKFDLMLKVLENEQGLKVMMEYNTSLLLEETVRNMAEQFQLLLSAVLADVEQNLHAPQLITERDRRILDELNGTEREYSRRLAMDLFIERAEQHPERIALRYEGQSMTYGELHERSNRVANFLRGAGIGRNDLVSLLMERSLETLVGIYGILKAGAAYVPLDPEYPEWRIQFTLEDSASRFVLTKRGCLPHLQAIAAELPALETILLLDEAEGTDETNAVNRVESVWEAGESVGAFSVDGKRVLTWREMADQAPATTPALINEPADLAYLIYTSGSTGKPKGTELAHRALTNLLNWWQEMMPITEDDCIGQRASICFDMSIPELFWPLHHGARIVIVPTDAVVDAYRLRETMIAENISYLKFVPTLFTSFVSGLQEMGGANARIPSLRYVVNGGEALSPKPVNLWYDLFGTEAQLINQYGPTEAAVDVAIHKLDGKQSGTIPMGRVMPNNQCYVLDPHGNLCPVGVTGELHIGGVQLAEGYRNLPEKTAEAFLPNFLPNTPGDRLYKTGDLVRVRRDGVLEYVGRLDSQVKVRGFRIELGEIEEVLSRHPEIQNVGVIVHTEADGNQTLAAYFTSAAAKLDVAELKDYLGEKVPPYMVPAFFVQLDRLPQTPNGKVDRKALVQLAQDEGFEQEAVQNEFAAPSTPTEEQVAAIWKQLLKKDDISVRDNFFELGGHSLTLMLMHSRIRNTMDVALELKDLFANPTVEGLAAHLDAVRGMGEPEQAAEVRIERAPKREHYELSHAQKRLWFLHKFDPENTAYNVYFNLVLRGDLRVDLFKQALHEIVKRHSALRTVFREVDGLPRQFVQETSPFALVYEDWTNRSAQERESALRAKQRETEQLPFNLSEGPLLRCLLFRTGAEEYHFLLQMHHIITDAWSRDLLGKELHLIYSALVEGREPNLAPVELQYEDYAEWQASQAEQGIFEQEQEYWLKTLAKPLPVLELPTDFPRPDVQTYSGDLVRVVLQGDLMESARRASRQEDVSLFMFLFAAYVHLLQHVTAQDDLIVGVPIAGRTAESLSGTLGFFVNTLAIRVRTEGISTVRELVQEIKRLQIEAFQNQSVPFDLLIERLNPERDMSRPPIFSTMFQLEVGQRDVLQGGHYTLELAENAFETMTSKFDMQMTVLDFEGQDCQLFLQYNTDLFKPETAEKFTALFQQILAEFAANPAAPLGSMTFLTEADRKAYAELNATEKAYDNERLLLDAFIAQAEAHPERIALRDPSTGRTMTYGELHERSNRLGHFLRGRGAGRNRLVAIMMERSVELMVGLYGILKSGAAYVPIDPEYPAARIQYMLADSGAHVLLVKEQYLERVEATETLQTVLFLDETLEEAPHLNADGVQAAIWKDVAASPASAPEAIGTPDDLAYMIYTSGSTGRPKGVLIQHRAILNRLHWHQETFAATPRDVIIQRTTVCFDDSVIELFWPLRHGATLSIMPQEIVLDPLRMIGQLAAERATYMQFVPSLLSVVVSALQEMPVESRPQLRTIIVSGEALPSKLVEQWFALYPTGTKLANLYGPTEAAVDVSGAIYEAPQERITIGVPLANTQLYVLNPQGTLCPVNVKGELYVGGVQLAQGYHNQPEKTAESFLPNLLPGTPGDRLYRTGDAVRLLPNGTLEFLGRVDNQVKIRGFRIELGEIEEALMQYPTLAMAAVIVRQGPDGNHSLFGYCTADDEIEISALKNHLRAKLPDYMVPPRLVQLETMPLTPNGKVDRKALEQYAADDALETVSAYTAPTTETEQKLAGIWADLLKRGQVGVHDNFFDLGGHSLLAIQTLNRIANELGAALQLKDLFAHPTIAELSTHIEDLLLSGNAHTRKQIPKAPPQEQYALSNAQKRLWITYKLDPSSKAYNVPLEILIKRELNVKLFEKAAQQLIARHDALRTVFVEVGGEPRQKVLPTSPVRMFFKDLSSFPQDEQAAFIRESIALSESKPFDLRRGPLLRLMLFKREEGLYHFYLNLHHIITDGWSNELIAREHSALYEALLAGVEPALPEPALQYTDYAEWQEAFTGTDAWLAEESYWLNTLAKPLPVLELPTDFPRPDVRTDRGDAVWLTIPRALTTALRNKTAEGEYSMYMLLLAGYVLFLNQETRQQDLIVGTPIAGRLTEALESVVGFFVNTLAIRTRLDGVESVQDLLQTVKEQFLNAYEHQGYPFDLLIEKLNPERDLSRTPIFSTMFTYRQFLEEMSPMYEPLVPDTHEISKFDLTVNVSEAEDEMRVRFEYNTDLFEKQTVERFASSLETALGAIAFHPTAPLDDAVRRAGESAPEDTLQVRFERQAALTPQNIALSWEDATWTYDQLNREANRIAHLLRLRGAGEGTPVILALERTPQMIAAILGVVKVGGVYIPVDPDYPEERIAYIVENSEARHLVTTGEAQERIAAFQGEAVVLDRETETLASLPDSNPESVIHAESLIYAIYTSGSTGKPKGVLLTHRNVLRLMDVTQPYYRFGERDVWTMFHSYCFDFSVWEMYGALLYGGRVVIVPKATAQSTPAFYDLLLKERVTVLNQTPSAFYRLIEADGKNADSTLGDHLRCVIFGGEALNFTHLRPFLDRYPESTQLVNMYGITETTVHATFRPITRQDVDAVWKGSPIGQPLDDLTFYLLDENRQPVVDGEPGEIYIAGPGLAARYLNNPEKTAEVFLELDGQRVYKTGDIARRHENGELEYLGRVDHQVKIRGFRIELGEIENTLARHDAVTNVLVVASPDANGDLQLVAYLETDADLPAKEWRRYVRQSLPEYMIPARVVCVPEFPVTPNGKIDRNALHEIGEAQAREQQARAAERAAMQEQAGQAAGGTGLSADRIVTELSGIWREVLQHDDFDVDDNFFDVGGHSFALAKAQSLLNEKLSLDLPLTDLFKYPTIQSLADSIAPSAPPVEEEATVRERVPHEQDAVAIIGMACRFPEASSPFEFWQNLKNGRESVREFPPEEVEDTPFNQDPETRAQLVRAAGILENIDQFDAEFFGVSEKEARLLHPQHRLFLECSWEAIEDAGYNVESLNGKVSVYGGCGGSEYLPRHGIPNLTRAEIFQGMIASQPRFLTTRVSYKLNLKGESMFVDTACSTSLVAIHMACESLRNHKSDYALAGGSTILLPQKRGYVYEPGFVHSEDGHCRAFDKNSTGTADGSGAGVVFLKRLSDALRDGDPIYAVIRGSAVNNDGSFKIGYTAPSQSGQAEVIAQAHASAGVTPDDITYIETHGTGTVLGDPIEVAALTEVFRRKTARKNYCAIGSIKTNIGHLDTAAGVAGLMKTALALHHRELPPSLNFKEPNPACKFEESPFYVITENKPWEAENGIRRAGVSAFGIGGTNAHVILEEAPSDFEADSDEQEAIQVRGGLL
ncbi:non-ribosomal peptide synthetase [Tumebacillus flagellatus]|uniref:Phenolphthiocerol/phthiocerol polyketide synthase subunit E n=1 Tax=Tumebacillus flagellatus TaxID=1157490 RepID=A0A074M9U9_9BACL|nr:non-ribosomal peptide synthetase [Tumebacillus flagellatus]KEO82732.1 hypothetical protein EL26_14295 [Tumebacillus flagellatus]